MKVFNEFDLLFTIFVIGFFILYIIKRRQKRKRFIRLKKKKFLEEKKKNPVFKMSPIAFFESVFTRKNGTPRQGRLAPSTKGKFRVTGYWNNLHDSKMCLDGLEGFSHLWIIFIFHENRKKESKKMKPKTRPPRLNGKRVGVFACRTPYRPNEIGLTLVKIDQIDQKTGYVHISGVDMIDGTPIIDIKPYIQMDAPSKDEVVGYPEWLEKPYPSDLKHVVFSNEANEQLEEYLPKLKFFSVKKSKDVPIGQLKSAIREVILLDPRSKYRKSKCLFDDYYIHFDRLNMLCRIDRRNVDTMCVVRMALTYDDCDLSKESEKENCEEIKEIRGMGLPSMEGEVEKEFEMEEKKEKGCTEK